jgi:hypothetical protein
LAREFAAEHPEWDDEKLFQEARRWNSAFMQHITAKEVFYFHILEKFYTILCSIFLLYWENHYHLIVDIKMM